MSERVAPFLPQPMPTGDFTDAGADAVSHEQLVVRPLKKPGRFDPKPIDPEIKKRLDAFDEKTATEAAERLFRRYLRVQAQFQAEEPDAPTSHLLDVYFRVQDLWEHLEHEPVELGRKASLKAAIEYNRRRLRTEPFASRITEALKEQKRIDQAYRQAKILWMRAHGARVNEVLHPLPARDAQAMATHLRAYLGTTLIEKPTIGMRELDQEIRTIAAEIFREQPPSADRILFDETQHSLGAYRIAEIEHGKNPTRATKNRLEDTRRAFEKALEQEMFKRRTPEMRAEYEGFQGLKRQLFQDPFIVRVYEDLRKRDQERANEIELDLAIARLRPGELAAITRLRRYENEAMAKHRHLIITQHRLFSDLEEEFDEGKKDDLRRQFEEISRTLKEPILCYPPHAFTVDSVVKVIGVIHARWSQKATNPESPSHVQELEPLWQSLQVQYGYVLQLAEALNQVMEQTSLEDTFEMSIQETLANMRQVEQHYATSVFRPLQESARAADGDLWLLENTVPANKEALVEKTKRALDEVEARTKAVTMSFPSITRWQQIDEFAYRTIPSLQQRFEERTGVPSAGTTARPPRGPSSPETDLFLSTDRVRE